MQRTRAKWLVAGSALLVGLLALSGWHPYGFATRTLEVLPVVIALPILQRGHELQACKERRC